MQAVRSICPINWTWAAQEVAVEQKMDTSNLKSGKVAYVAMVMRAKQEYHQRQDWAILHPDSYCFITIQGADQSVFGVPHFVTTSKDMKWRVMRAKLTGVQQHPEPSRLHLLTITEEHETGASHIVKSLDGFQSDQVSNCALPPTHFVQMDNCTRWNKNPSLSSDKESLVAWRMFQTVEVQFLPIGHKQEDIDHAFNWILERPSSTDALTLLDLQVALKIIYKGGTRVVFVKHMANWSG